MFAAQTIRYLAEERAGDCIAIAPLPGVEVKLVGSVVAGVEPLGDEVFQG